MATGADPQPPPPTHPQKKTANTHGTTAHLTGSTRPRKTSVLAATVNRWTCANPKLMASRHPNEWCASVSGDPGRGARDVGRGLNQPRYLAVKMEECRRICTDVTVNTEARLQATLNTAPHVRQLTTNGGRGPPAEKCPVAGEMHSGTQLPCRCHERPKPQPRQEPRPFDSFQVNSSSPVHEPRRQTCAWHMAPLGIVGGRSV